MPVEIAGAILAPVDGLVKVFYDCGASRFRSVVARVDIGGARRISFRTLRGRVRGVPHAQPHRSRPRRLSALLPTLIYPSQVRAPPLGLRAALPLRPQIPPFRIDDVVHMKKIARHRLICSY
jgi:hypothetical protein